MQTADPLLHHMPYLETRMRTMYFIREYENVNIVYIDIYWIFEKRWQALRNSATWWWFMQA